MKSLSKRLNKMEIGQRLSYEVLNKLNQSIFVKILIGVNKKEEYILSKREQKICELHEKVVRVDPELYKKHIYSVIDKIAEKEKSTQQ